MEMKKYMSVVRLGHRSTVNVLNVGDEIIVQEKLDGANASFKEDNCAVAAFSRNNKLDISNSLRGFYDFARKLDADSLHPDYIYFGEWLVRHKLDYGENEKQFYLYDIYDTKREEYREFELVESEAARLNLNLIPILYRGPYISFEHLQQFVGKSMLGEVGEGVVVKNIKYRDRFGNQLFVKLVSDAFREMQQQKAPKDPKAKTGEFEFIETFLTRPRVEKLLHKLVDEGILQEDFGLEDMGLILRHLGNRSYEDLMKEESTALERILRQKIGRKLPIEVKAIINEKSQEVSNIA